jgi:hypothetical protein
MSERVISDPTIAGWELNPDTGYWMWAAGGGSDLSDYYTKSESDVRYLQSETDPTVPDHVKSISTADIDKWNNPPSGGGESFWVEESPGVIKYAGTAKATDLVAG